MHQHTKGVVDIILLVLLEIYCSLQQWKNFENLSRIDKVIANKSGVRFFWTTLYMCTTRVLLLPFSQERI